RIGVLPFHRSFVSVTWLLGSDREVTRALEPVQHPIRFRLPLQLRYPLTVIAELLGEHRPVHQAMVMFEDVAGTQRIIDPSDWQAVAVVVENSQTSPVIIPTS